MGSREGDRKPFRKVIVAGTFDRLHEGHKALLRTSAELGEEVLVCIADGPLLIGKNFREKIESYDVRKRKVEDFLRSINARFSIVKILDPIGPAGSDPRTDAIVVSTETYPGALRVNFERKKNGLKELVIVVCPLVVAEDGKPISSSRIRAGEIDVRGKLRTHISMG
ncbi:MAG TPA: pantetheine-phosphate adenylyltransferase [Candidatus Korarchaeota archaeon]|nr:pantetheine-phosphate adenylyltransferase [Candidatus Korarchaeota archaeon]